jgi:hypothetical protein
MQKHIDPVVLFEKGQFFPLFPEFSQINLLIIILMIPFYSVLLIFMFYKLGNNFLYQFGLFSSVISFLLSLIL